MTVTLDGIKMSFNSLQRTNQKLASNPELSEYNKQVLEDFFSKCRSGGAGDAILRDYSSRFNKLAEHIDFKLDQPTQKELQELYAKFNSDEIRKNNGEKYSDYSKDKFESTLSKFYNWFIKKQGRGYNPDIDGEDLIEDLEMDIDLSVVVNPDALPTPSEVREVSNHAKRLRDKTVVVLLWSTGARVGELFDTQYNDNVLTWKDIEFKEDKAWIKLDGKTGKREIPVKTGMPLLRELWNESDADLEDPVFTELRRKSKCPECSAYANIDCRTTKDKSTKYSCPNCNWKGNGLEVKKVYDALGDHAVRRIIERTVKAAGLKGEFATNPHDFGRKARAVYKARIGFTDHQLRAFFGWSETSDAPKHYLQCVKEDLEKALAEEYGEEVDYDNGYDEDALRPVECATCSAVNSATSDLCRECNSALSEQGEDLTNKKQVQGLNDNLAELAKKRDINPEEFAEMLEEKSMLELMETLM